MARKEMTLILCRQNHIKENWKYDISSPMFVSFLDELTAELARFDVSMHHRFNDDIVINIASYADMLNSVKIASPLDGFTGICVGHVIGKSPDLNFLDDIRRAVNRIAFAPETIQPEDHNRKVCHNCGCGC